MSTYTDALNRTIDIQNPPARIVSLVPSLTEALFDFGLADAIVGVTKFCVEPAAQVVAKANARELPTFISKGPTAWAWSQVACVTCNKRR